MATKIKIMKLLQEMRGMAEITNRRPHSRPSGALLLEFRSPSARTSVAKRKRVITIHMHEPLDIPHPVKIVHRKAHPAASAQLPAL